MNLYGRVSANRVELRYWTGDGSLYEAEFGDHVEVNIVQDLAAGEVNSRGWRMAKEPIEPLGDQRAEVSGIRRMVRHSPGHLTPDQRRIVELEMEVALLRRRLGEAPE